MHLQNHAGHLPVDSTLLVLEAGKQNLRQYIECSRQLMKPLQIPGRHVHRDAPNRVSILAADKFLHEELCHLAGVDIAVLFLSQGTKYFGVGPPGIRNTTLRSDHCFGYVIELITDFKHAHDAAIKTQDVELLTEQFCCQDLAGLLFQVVFLSIFL